MADGQSKRVLHVGYFMLHVDLVPIDLQEDIVLEPRQQLHLTLCYRLADPVAQERRESTSVSCADDHWVGDMLAGAELGDVLGANYEEGGVGSAEDEALDILDGEVFGEAELGVKEAEPFLSHQESGFVFNPIDIDEYPFGHEVVVPDVLVRSALR